ncbi:MAG: EamA/RhaT family transporter [Myxococcales bacterium]|nr:EamA/RhaT family transporter [Myxococcales bacterium]
MKLSRGVSYMIASALGFSVMAVLVKVAAARLPMGEIVLARTIVTLVVSYAMVRRLDLRPWGTNKRGLVLRGFLGFAGLTLYYLSLALLPLADATTLQQTVPLITTLIAWAYLRERVGWHTAVALACGIAGVSMIVHPSGAGLDPVGIGLGLGAALCSSMAYITVRQLTRTENPLVIVFYFPLIATPLAVPWAAATWVTPVPLDLLLLVAIGLATQWAQVYLTKALAIETASRATSIGYIQVAFAMVWQWIVFSSAPTIWTLAGAALIVAGTITVARAKPRVVPASPVE